MESFWNSSNILKIFMKWKLHIIIITFLGMIIIGASTYLIKPKFKSYAVAYPVNLGQYSDEEHSEQMIQILQSRNIMDSVINKFDLAKHYEIDSSYVHFQSTLYDTYNENVSVSKTQYDAVQIKVYDTNPDTASLIVNSIIDFYNKKVRSIHREKFKEVMDLSMADIKKWQNSIDTLNTKLQVYKTKYNIQNIGFQIKELTQGIFRSNGNTKLINKAENQLELIAKYGAEFDYLNGLYWAAYKQLNESKENYEEAKTEYNKEITYASVVTNPYPADLKSSPKRVIITLLGGLSVLVLVILIIGFIENKKKNI